MKVKRMSHAGSGNLVKRSIARLIKHPAAQSQSYGFCICPGCRHLVFDVALTGTCPYCQCHFCPSCVLEKHRR